jgi:hypothetical protein
MRKIMKRIVVVLSVVAVMLLTQAVYAVELQQGGYMRYEYVALFGIDYFAGNEWGTDWYPSTVLGQFGALSVTEGTHPTTHGRTITINQNSSFAPGVIYEDEGTYQASGPYYNVLSIGWFTDYDADLLQMRVVRRRAGVEEVIWTQMESGSRMGYGNILESSPILPGDKVVFQLVVVPEPMGMFSLSSGILIVALGALRKRAR